MFAQKGKRRIAGGVVPEGRVGVQFEAVLLRQAIRLGGERRRNEDGPCKNTSITPLLPFSLGLAEERDPFADGSADVPRFRSNFAQSLQETHLPRTKHSRDGGLKHRSNSPRGY